MPIEWNLVNKCRRSFVLFVVAGLSTLCSPSVLLSGDTVGPPVAVEFQDVRLQVGGVLIGYILDEQGRPVESAQVQIVHHGRRVAIATTNSRGSYMIAGLRGGVHVVHAGKTRGNFRFWTRNSAPPKAKPVALTVVSGDVVRGQLGSLYTVDPNTMTVGAVAIAGLVVAIDKQESINDLKTALSQHEADSHMTRSASLAASLDSPPVSP